MSDKKDERDIDEVLASIDAMLAENDLEVPINPDHKAKAAKAPHHTANTLLEEHPSTEKPQDSNQIDEDESRPRPRIVLTEEYLESSAQESLPLWAAQVPTGQDESTHESVEHKTIMTKTEVTEHEETTKETIQITAKNTMKNDDNHHVLSQLDDSLDRSNLDTLSQTSNTDDVFEHDNSKQTLWLEDTSERYIEDLKVSEREDALETTTQANTTQANHDKSNVENENDITHDEFDAVFEAIANDDTITFDISEAMSEETVYDIEVLDKELVEAFVHDVAHEYDDDHTDKNMKISPDVDLSAVDIANDITDKTDTSVENVKDKTKPLAEHIQTSVQEAAIQDDTISLNPDELDPIIEAISDDVRIKVNQHLQQVLPELVSDALLEHLAALRDNNT